MRAMRKNNILIICYILLSTLSTLCSAKDDILIVTEEWPPYNYLKNEEITGFSYEIVQQILVMKNKNYDIQLVPSMRGSNILNRRPHTMFFSMFRTPERESRYKWIGPLADGAVFFYKRKDNPIQIKSLQDMKNPSFKICTRQAGLIPHLLVKLGFRNLDMGGSTGKQIYQKLLAGRCDLAISDADLGVRHDLKLLNVNMDDVLEQIPIPVFQAELYIACSKDISDQEVQEWQVALDTLKANGIYENIFQKYHQHQ